MYFLIFRKGLFKNVHIGKPLYNKRSTVKKIFHSVVEQKGNAGSE